MSKTKPGRDAGLERTLQVMGMGRAKVLRQESLNCRKTKRRLEWLQYCHLGGVWRDATERGHKGEVLRGLAGRVKNR